MFKRCLVDIEEENTPAPTPSDSKILQSSQNSSEVERSSGYKKRKFFPSNSHMNYADNINNFEAT